MAKSGFFNKKFIIISISVIALIALIVGLVLIFRPRVDLNAPYNDTYSLVYDEDYNYILQENSRISQIVSGLDGVESENYSSVKQAFQNFEVLVDVLNSQNTFLLDNLLFTEDKDENMLEIQQNLSQSRDNLTQKIDDCKQYIDQYLSNSAIQNYPDNDALFIRVNNYYSIYTNFLSNLGEYYSYVSNIVENYLIDNFAINPLTKYNLKSLYLWANRICQNYLSSDIDHQVASVSIEDLKNFSDSIACDSTTYVLNIDSYDQLLSNFNVLNFDEIINSLANATFDEYVSSLEGGASQSALILKNQYYLI